MPFTLEVLKAKHGDCLILHSGTEKKPQIMVIDGGPSGVYSSTLKPRLLKIKENWSVDTLPIEMVMISHIDDDHINGILNLTKDMMTEKANHKPSPSFEIENLWCNSFDDIIGNVQLPSAASASTAAAAVASVSDAVVATLKDSDPHLAAVITSVAQGRGVRDNAEKLGLAINEPFKKLKGSKEGVVRGDIGQKAITFGDVKLTVLNPSGDRLQKLQVEWDKKLKVAAKKDKTITTAAVAELMVSADNSPYNLSSIVCLAEVGGKRILLTGDARMDDIETALKDHKLLDAKNQIEVDIFKLPHHGSIRNAKLSLLKMVKAKNYVISADGSYDNPDSPLLDMLADNIKTGTVYMTYEDGKLDLGKKTAEFEKRLKAANSKLKVVFRGEDEPSVKIELDGAISY